MSVELKFKNDGDLETYSLIDAGRMREYYEYANIHLKDYDFETSDKTLIYDCNIHKHKKLLLEHVIKPTKSCEKCGKGYDFADWNDNEFYKNILTRKYFGYIRKKVPAGCYNDYSPKLDNPVNK